MSASSIPISLQLEKAFISSSINETALQGMLLGVYSVIYAETLYVYLTKKSSQHWVVVGAISLSYFAYIADSVLFWYINQNALVNNSETRETLFAALAGGSDWPIFANDFIIFPMSALADGILIWRCFNIWNRSLRAIILPSVLLLCEIVMDLIVLVIEGIENLTPSGTPATVVNDLVAAQGFTTFATTLSATLIISYRIYRVSSDNTTGRSGRLFRQILEILIQSSAIYALAAFANAIPILPRQTSRNITLLISSQTYTSALFLFSSGLAPTILVARVAFLDDRTTESSTDHDSVQVSGLQFHVPSTAWQGSNDTGTSYHLAYGGSEISPTLESGHLKLDEGMTV